MTPNSTRFLRDRFTLLAYAMLGYFAYLQAAPGVAMPLLRHDLHLNYTVGGLHVSALAMGAVTASLSNSRVIARLGRPRAFWIGSGGMTVGALLVAVGHHPAITISGMVLMGLFGAWQLSAIQSGLADRHGELRTIALTESNVAASASTILTPLLVGGFERIGIGWQWAFVLPALVWSTIYLRAHTVVIPSAPETDNTAASDATTDLRTPLPRVFWIYWAAMIFAVAIEWSLVAWSADFMVKAGDLSSADASLLMSLYYGAMLTGRITGSTLARQADVARLLFAALALGAAGFILLWQAPLSALRVAGLFITGLGVANLFPFLLSLGLSTAPKQSDAASSRLTLSGGLAILFVPQILGAAADQIGIQAAFGLIFVLFVLTTAVVSAARRMETR